MSEKVVPSPATLDFTSTCRQLDLSVYIPTRLLAGDKLIGRSISMTTLETMGEEKEKKEEGRGARRSCDSRTTRAGEARRPSSSGNSLKLWASLVGPLLNHESLRRSFLFSFSPGPLPSISPNSLSRSRNPPVVLSALSSPARSSQPPLLPPPPRQPKKAGPFFTRLFATHVPFFAAPRAHHPPRLLPPRRHRLRHRRLCLQGRQLSIVPPVEHGYPSTGTHLGFCHLPTW